MKRIKTIVMLLACASLLSGCYNEYAGFLPAYLWWSVGPPENASKDFKEGYWDGCNTSLSEAGYGPWRTAATIHYDTYRMLNNKDYSVAWQRGSDDCLYWSDHSAT